MPTSPVQLVATCPLVEGCANVKEKHSTPPIFTDGTWMMNEFINFVLPNGGTPCENTRLKQKPDDAEHNDFTFVATGFSASSLPSYPNDPYNGLRDVS
jgi:hypothetical protein